MIMFLLAAMLPAFILFWYVYSRDITPEPKNVVIMSLSMPLHDRPHELFLKSPYDLQKETAEM